MMSATKKSFLVTILLSCINLSSSFQSPSFIPKPASLRQQQQQQQQQHAITTTRSNKPPSFPSSTAIQMSSYPPEDTNYEVSIEFCTGCHWMPRATWMAQELLSTFKDELDIVSLIPSRPGSDSNPEGGKFAISLNGELLWDRAFEGGFPEIKELKCLVRDFVCPDRDLGHIEQQVNGKGPDDEEHVDESAEIEALVKEIEAIDEEIKILDQSIGNMEKEEDVASEVEEESAPVMVMEESAPVVEEESAPVVEESEPVVVEDSEPVVEESAPVVAEESAPVVEESEAEPAEAEKPAEVNWEPAPVEKKSPLFNDFVQFGFENL